MKLTTIIICLVIILFLLIGAVSASDSDNKNIYLENGKLTENTVKSIDDVKITHTDNLHATVMAVKPSHRLLKRQTKKKRKYKNKRIEQLIDEIISQSNSQLRDKSFRFITSNRPKSSHAAFEFPGKFLKVASVGVKTKNNRYLEMDYAAVVLPDGEIKMMTAVNVEHQSDLPDYEKIESMIFYNVGLIHETNLPAKTIVITHKKPKKEVMCYEYEGQEIIIHYIYVSPQKISERLSTLEDKISNNEILTEEEALNFAYIAIFADRDAKKIMRKLVKLFGLAKGIDGELGNDIWNVLCLMIKYHFKDDLKQAKELLYMVTEILTNEEFEKLTSIERIIYNQKRKEDVIQEVLKHQSDELQQKDNTIQEKNKTIEQQARRIKELEAQNNMG